jgi:transposase
MSKQEMSRYTLELREEAVKLVIDQGFSVSEAALRLNIPKSTLTNWVAKAARKENKVTPAGSESMVEMAAELKKLRKELIEAKMERDILKKAAAYFARASLPGTHS